MFSPQRAGVSGNEPGSLAADIAQLRSEIATEKGDPDAQRRRMEQRKASVPLSPPDRVGIDN